ncbi:HI0074 family nucleotidyltransferase substrate-binding subunit [Leptospira sp. GIMC2001]|uniref:HI0074 family nucleotidyltransferase substrate-binding subunit n=1 Tax=Leptospira sp. GIMC2001 TaxID=1513297 RepID=UPI00234A535B|nr:HI0074 family nucleotidyltransferase substrate-binding subunit [Leptospira sp. GIMC2001]WCL51189.1 HI0074 family nucleotidyltransferase substrate-binding subunit [Leptospira sp. GIMC2001]
MSLDLSPFYKSLQSLENSLGDYKLAYESDKKNFLITLQAGVIQNFEVTYELAWKFIKRWLEVNISPNITMGITKKELYRLAGENGLIDNVEDWFEYHKVRNETVHTYDREVASRAFDITTKFLKSAELLRKSLELRND